VSGSQATMQQARRAGEQLVSKVNDVKKNWTQYPKVNTTEDNARTQGGGEGGSSIVFVALCIRSPHRIA
jgi:hypothetical protein